MKKLMTINLLCAVFIAVSAKANLLVDPGFEANPLTTASNALNFFSTYQGIWGAEVATIVGAENAITPAQGVKMLHMDDDGISWTQGFQVTDVTSYAALIDSGTAIVNISALVNAHPKLSAALSNVSVLFFSAANFGSQIGSPVSGNLTLDNSPNTWQTDSATGSIPVGTRWLVTQVAYQDASLLGPDGALYPGYVDAANLTIVPEPAAICLLGLGFLGFLRKRKAI